LAKLAESRSSVAGARRGDLWLERDCRPASHIVGNTWEPESARPRFRSCWDFAAKWPPCFQGLESMPSPPSAGSWAPCEQTRVASQGWQSFEPSGLGVRV